MLTHVAILILFMALRVIPWLMMVLVVYRGNGVSRFSIPPFIHHFYIMWSCQKSLQHTWPKYSMQRWNNYGRNGANGIWMCAVCCCFLVFLRENVNGPFTDPEFPSRLINFTPDFSNTCFQSRRNPSKKYKTKNLEIHHRYDKTRISKQIKGYFNLPFSVCSFIFNIYI